MKTTKTYYYNMDGKLIWKDKMVFRRLWRVGDELIHEYQKYIVRRVVVVNTVQHVNTEKAGKQ